MNVKDRESQMMWHATLMVDPIVLRPKHFISPKRRNITAEKRLTGNISIEKVKKTTHGDKWVNNRYYPKGTGYGYRLDGIKSLRSNHTFTLDQMRELCYNLSEFLKEQKE